VAAAIAAERGGVRPSKIGEPLPYEILEEIASDTEVEGDDE
jgi:hypothetical protein